MVNFILLYSLMFLVVLLVDCIYNRKKQEELE
jgi:hypothetical protein